MSSIISTFHIDLNILIAQIINFTIVLFVLYKFAYKPLLKTLNDRSNKIEKGIKDSEAAQKKLVEIENREKEILAKARKEAQTIIEAAEKTAVKNKEEIAMEAKKQSENILAEAQKRIEEEKKKMFQEVKSEIADLVVAATGRVIDEKIDLHKDREIIEKAIR